MTSFCIKYNTALEWVKLICWNLKKKTNSILIEVSKLPILGSQNSNLLLVFKIFHEESSNGTKYRNRSTIDQKISEKSLFAF